MPLPTVLVIEDNPADLYLVGEAIKQNGIGVKLVTLMDGESALRFIQNGTELPNLVVLDLNLPKRNGIQILEVIRATPNSRHIPVIVFTSSLSESDAARINALGVTACMLKSLDLDEFNLIGAVIKQALLLQDGTERDNPFKPPAA